MDLQLAQELIKIDALESRLGDIEGKAVGVDQHAWVAEQRAALERMRAQLASAEARGK